MVRVGVVGVGAMGEHHARVYTELGVQLVGVADPDLNRAEEVATKYNTKFFSDYRELLPQVEAVTIATPTSLHSQVALDFIRQNVHCLVEKPIASTIEEARQMIREAEQNKAKLMVGHIERFNPAVAKLKQLIDEGIIGELMIISTRRVGPFVPRIRDVGIIVDSATHDIDIARYLVGKEPLEVFAKAGRFRHHRDDHAIIVLDFGSAAACVEVNWFTPYKVRSLVATGSEGIAYLDYTKQEVTVHNSQGMKKVRVDKAEPLKLELKHFLECVQSDMKPLVDGDEGLKVLEIALKASERRV